MTFSVTKRRSLWYGLTDSVIGPTALYWHWNTAWQNPHLWLTRCFNKFHHRNNHLANNNCLYISMIYIHIHTYTRKHTRTRVSPPSPTQLGRYAFTVSESVLSFTKGSTPWASLLGLSPPFLPLPSSHLPPPLREEGGGGGERERTSESPSGGLKRK